MRGACTWIMSIPSFKHLTAAFSTPFPFAVTCYVLLHPTVTHFLLLTTDRLAYHDPYTPSRPTSSTGLDLNLASKQKQIISNFPTVPQNPDSRSMATVVFKVCALTATLLSTVALAAPTSSSGCGRVHIMCARGTSQAPGVGSIGEVADQIKLYADAAIISAVPYPASQTNPDYLDSVKLGATHLQSMIKSTVDRCPGVRIVLLGYSQVATSLADIRDDLLTVR